jgi:3-methylfumaryl-CoA hydratase
MSAVSLSGERSHLTAWIGRAAQASDVITPVPATALAATLDRDAPNWLAGDRLPELWHWLYFLPLQPQAELGHDGHPKRGGFLPPVPLPRRMWAGSRIEFREPLAVGEAVLRTSTIADVSEKQGRSGALVFVKVRHEIAHDGGGGARNGGNVAIVEEHDIVYRAAPQPGDAPADAPGLPEPVVAQFSRTIDPTPMLLFRYSALTFNPHRIHYDLRYCREDEGYPGLVVHGPLQATLLLDLLYRAHPQRRLRRFAFKALRPVFDTAPFALSGRLSDDGRQARLWTRDAGGALAMDATADLAEE